jgi:hypothetical protein
LKIPLAIFSIIAFLTQPQKAIAECFGEGDYQVCSESSTDSNGNIQIESFDSEGNTYSIKSESVTTDDGASIRSYDSEGNEYSVRSWSDSTGVHSEDSDGNRCTITNSGQMIGCD